MAKAAVNLTIDPEVAKELDHQVKHMKVRNRSVFVENILREVLLPKVPHGEVHP